MYKIKTKNQAKRLRATTTYIAIAKLEERLQYGEQQRNIKHVLRKNYFVFQLQKYYFVSDRTTKRDSTLEEH